MLAFSHKTTKQVINRDSWFNRFLEYWQIHKEKDIMEPNHSASSQKSFLIRDLLRDLIAKSSENNETSDSGNFYFQKHRPRLKKINFLCVFKISINKQFKTHKQSHSHSQSWFDIIRKSLEISIKFRQQQKGTEFLQALDCFSENLHKMWAVEMKMRQFTVISSVLIIVEKNH